MKKILLLLGLSLALGSAFGQVVFQENWDGNGPGYDNWIKIDVDGHTPAHDFMTDAWVRKDRGYNDVYVSDFGGPAGDYCVASTSFYNPSGQQSNDWLISPEITLPSGELTLFWDVNAPNESHQDGYLLKLSTTAGTTVDDFDVTLLTVEEAECGWTNQSISLAEYAGQTIRLAWVNNSTNKAYLLVDNIRVGGEAEESPDCVTLVYPADGETGIDFSANINFTWSPATTGGTPVHYDLFISQYPNGTGLEEPIASDLVDTNLSHVIIGLQYNTTYYWKVIAKNPVGEATDCAVHSFTTQENPFAPYCGITFTQIVLPITNVNFAGIDNASDANGGSCHEPFIDVIGQVSQGGSYDLTIKANTLEYEFRFIAFIDWNQDGEFSGNDEVYPITETIYNSTGEDDASITHTIQVPANAALGTTRMRIKSASINPMETDVYNDPCDGMYGQAEDYTIEVSAPSNINSLASQKLSIYPNPTSGMFKVSIDLPQEEDALLTIINSNGQNIKRINLDNVKTLNENIDMRGYAKGIYTVQITTGKNTINRKVIVR